ncbi:PREDICTED: uncharacterized protein LOC108566080 [Nicrophorus vespilloides]|uniref:Uncharacterized protein LOC108566080 n=1 Tax=Nicrophorus vespilloides TaxID=110193 RepID=A0ABM1N380_NICVS|nr:PREDICTED: uncharacterized protein LOC108566080 [Nicrophorus vespilloides]
MPRAPPGLSLLLMAALAFATHHHPPSSQQQTPPLETINPWLSACDLQPASATDLKGACSAMWGPGPRCPPPCTQYNSTTQCLFYMNDSHKEKVCGRGFSPERRRDELKKLRMRHCCEHTAISALPERVLQGGQDCLHLLDGLLEVDALAARLTCEFAGILYRYDCTQKYSIKHRCEDCKVIIAINHHPQSNIPIIKKFKQQIPSLSSPPHYTTVIFIFPTRSLLIHVHSSRQLNPISFKASPFENI